MHINYPNKYYIYADLQWQRRKKGCNEIGFVDPHIVFTDPVTPKPNWKSEWESNLMNFLVNQRHKKDILFLYNFKWVLIMSIILNDSYVDSS